MKTITPISQSGFDLTVEFVFDDNSRRIEKISMRAYFTDEVKIVGRVDEAGNPILDKHGNQITEKVIEQVWHQPAENIGEFLRNYGSALEAGIAAEKAPSLDMALFGNPL